MNDVHIERKYIPAADGAVSANSAAGFLIQNPLQGFGKKAAVISAGAQQGHQMMENKFHKLFLRIIRVPDIRGNRRISVKGIPEKVSEYLEALFLQPAASFLIFRIHGFELGKPVTLKIIEMGIHYFI